MWKMFKASLKYLLPFVLAVFIYSLVTNYRDTSSFLSVIYQSVMYVLSRFIIGLAIAYLLNFLVELLHKRLHFPRWLSILSSYLLVLGLFVWVIIEIIPLMMDSINQIIGAVPAYYVNVQEFLSSVSGKLQVSEDVAETIDGFIGGISTSIFNVLAGFLNYPFIEDVLKSSTRALINFFFGLLVSIYALVEKETLLRALKRFVIAVFPQKRSERILDVSREANKIFSRYLVGKIIDSLIIGILSYILYLIFGIPLAPFLAVLAAITNMIPYFGPFLGGTITVLVLLCFEPISAVYALVIMIVLQALDAFYIGPKILGDAVGISPLLTIVAITVGGDIGGFLGMFIGVPVLAVFNTMFYQPFLRKREAARCAEKLAKDSEDAGLPPEAKN